MRALILAVLTVLSLCATSPGEPVATASYQDQLARIATALEEANDQTPPPGEHEQGLRDLEAQEAMAFWAQAMFWGTMAGVMVGLGSLALLLRTVQYTRAALIEAERATQAARDAVTETRRIGESQVRAYLAISNITLSDFTNDTFNANVAFTNKGPSPAQGVRGWAQVFYRRNPDNDPIRFDAKDKRRSLTEIGHGEVFRLPIPLQQLPWADGITRQSILDGTWSIVVAGFYSYRDIFGRRHRGVFRYLMRPSSLTPEGHAPLTSATQHNSSN